MAEQAGPFTAGSDPEAVGRGCRQHGDRPGAARARGRAGERWLRLYRWAPHCLSLRPARAGARRYDRSASPRWAWTAVRRPPAAGRSGTRDELTYAVAAPAEGLGGLREAYEEIHAMLRDAAPPPRCCGAAGAGPRRRRPPTPGACFAAPAGGEVMLDGRKVVGSAQLRERGARCSSTERCCSTDDQAMVGPGDSGRGAAGPGRRPGARTGRAARPGRRSQMRSRRRRPPAGRAAGGARSGDQGPLADAAPLGPGSGRRTGPGGTEPALAFPRSPAGRYIPAIPPIARPGASVTRSALARDTPAARASSAVAPGCRRSGRRAASSSSPASEPSMPVPTLMEGRAGPTWPTSRWPTSSFSGWPTWAGADHGGRSRLRARCSRGAGAGATR